MIEPNKEKYNIVYADPAWSYNDKMHAGERGADYKYKTMSIPDICNLPIRNIASDNSRLFLWVTMPFIFEAEKVMNAWGFDFKTCGFVWIKTNPKGDKAMKEVNKLFKDKFEANQLVSIEELLPLILKLCFMGNGSYSRCLRGDTKVYLLLNDKKIEKQQIKYLKFYDFNKTKIWTPSGWRKITNFVENKGSIVNRISTNVGDLFCTNNHKLIYKEPVFARYGNRDDGKRKVEHRIVEKDFDNFVKDNNKYIIKKSGYSANMLFSTRPLESPNPINELNKIKLCNTLGWIVGLFCAEGNYQGKSGLSFSLHAKEKSFYEKIEKYINGLDLNGDRYFNSKIKARRYEYGNNSYIKIYSKKIKNIIQEFVSGYRSKEKRLNIEKMLQTPSGFRNGFIEGMFDGDGTKVQNKYETITLCNRGLVIDISEIMHSVGIPTSLWLQNKPQYKNETLCYSYTVSKYYVNQDLPLEYKSTKVRTLTTKSIDENWEICDTYDITVEGHAFIANDIITHNSNAELCLVGARGKLERKSASVRSVIFAPSLKHSQKPPEARERIVQLYGDVPKVELFARGEAPEGWDIWGDEAINGISL